MTARKTDRAKVALLIGAVLAVVVALVAVVGLAGCGGGTTTTTAETPTTAQSSDTTQASTATTVAAATKNEVLKIGLITPLSGPISVVGLAFKRAYELGADKLNADGGVTVGDTNYTFAVTTEDGAGSPETSATAAKKLVYEDKLVFISGEVIDPATTAIYQVTSTAPNKVLMMVDWVNIGRDANDVHASKPLAFRPAVSPFATHEPDFDYLVKAYPNAKKVVMVYPNIGDEPLVQDMTDVAKAHGLEVAEPVVWEWGTTDFVPAMTQALATKPDVVVAVMSGQADAQLRAARDLGFKGVFMSTSPLAPEFFVKTAGAAACTDVIVNGMDMTHATPAMKEVQDASIAKYGEFVADQLVGYDQMLILKQLIEKAQSVEPDAIMAALDQVTNPGDLQTVFGDGHMGGKSDWWEANLVLYRPVPVVRLMNGVPELIGLVPVEEKK